MKSLVILALTILTACAATRVSTEEALKSREVEFVVNDSTIQFLGHINDLTSAEAFKALQEVPVGGKVNVVIQAAYGDPVYAAKVAKALRERDATCYARVAATVSFTLLQACKTRLVTSESVLYPYPITATAEDSTIDEIKAWIPQLEALEQATVQKDADRLGLTLEEYKAKVGRQGFKMIGFRDIFENNAADGKAEVICEHSDKTILLNIPVPNVEKPVSVEVGTCPLPRILYNKQLLTPQHIVYFGLLIDGVAEDLGEPI